jgi:predicted CopG family antitoxin
MTAKIGSQKTEQNFFSDVVHQFAGRKINGLDLILSLLSIALIKFE